MPADAAPATLFPLEIHADDSDIELTRFKSHRGVQKMLHELPAHVRGRVIGLVRFLIQQDIRKLEIVPSVFPRFMVNNKIADLPDGGPDHILDTLLIVAWWMEAEQRRFASRNDTWRCPECGEIIKQLGGHCPNTNCVSRQIMLEITGNLVLAVVDNSRSNGRARANAS